MQRFTLVVSLLAGLAVSAVSFSAQVPGQPKGDAENASQRL